MPAMPAGVENMAGELKQEGDRPPDPREAHPELCWVSPAHSVPPVAFPHGPNLSQAWSPVPHVRREGFGEWCEPRCCGRESLK